MNTHKPAPQQKSQLFTRGFRLVLQAAVAAGLVAGCSGGGSSDPGTAVGSAGASPPFVGSVQISGRLDSTTTPQASAYHPPAATPDGMTLVVDDAAISQDGVTYHTVLSGPMTLNLDTASRPVFATTDQLPGGDYQALRLKVEQVAWHATWTLANPSPCDGATSGQAQGTVNLAGPTNFYFKTAALGGDTLRHYKGRLPFVAPNYIGDINNPLLLGTPIEVTKNLATLDLVLGAQGAVTCSTVNAFSAQSNPALTIGGPATALRGATGVYIDNDHGEIGIANTSSDGISIFTQTAVASSSDGNFAPSRTIMGPATLLNGPSGIAFYHAPSDPTQDEIIVANNGNDSITIFGTGATGNQAPARTIAGEHHTNLDAPSAVAVWVDPGGTATNDELWVTNRGDTSTTGDDSITVYPRVDDKDATPLFTVTGADTGLSNPCGIAVATVQNPHTNLAQDLVLVANDQIPGTTQGADLVAVYDRAGIVTQPAGSVLDTVPAYTIGGSNTGLDQPCGVAVDSTNNEIYVANAGNGTVTVYDVGAVTDPASDGNVAPVRTITGLTAPQGLAWDPGGQQLWVAQRGAQPTMASLPLITPVTSDIAAASSPLQGKYNVVALGVDLVKGTSALGSQIPILYMERGSATFNPATAPWPSLAMNLDTYNVRQLMQPDCQIPVTNNVAGFYDTTSDGRLHAFFDDRDGSLVGAFHPSGQFFAAASYDGPYRSFVMLGVHDTGSAVPALTTGGLSSNYGYGGYLNSVFVNRFNTPPTDDRMRLMSLLGTAAMNATQLLDLSVDEDMLGVANPMGDYAPVNQGVPQFRHDELLLQTSSVVPHPGGKVEIQGPYFGRNGAVTADGNTGIFVGDTSKNTQNADGCTSTLGFSIALRGGQGLTARDIKGTYFIAAFGDNAGTTKTTRPHYRVAAGTVTFDGSGGGRLSLTNDDEGDVLSESESFTYVVQTKTLPSSGNVQQAYTVVDLLKSPGDPNPIASALVGNGGRDMIFYRDLQLTQQTVGGTIVTANTQRLVGLAIYRGP